MFFVDTLRQVLSLALLDRKIRFRRWMRRFPSIFTTPARLRGIIAAVLISMLLLCIGAFTVLGLAIGEDADALRAATDTVCLLFLALSFFSLYQIFHLDDCLDTYDFPDLRFAHSFGIFRKGVSLASRFAVRPLILEAGAYVLIVVSAAATAALSGIGFSIVAAVATGGALLLCVRAIVRVVKTFASGALLLLPPRYIGIGVIGIGAVGPLMLSVFIVAASPWILHVFEEIRNSEGIIVTVIHELLSFPPITALVEGLTSGSRTFWFLPLLFIIAATAAGSVVWAAPRNDYRIQLKLKQPLRPRINAGFSRRPALASVDKDARLIVRRGYVAWKQLGSIVSLAPVVAALSVMMQGLTLSVTNEFMPRHFMTTTLMMCSIIAVLSFTSMLLSAFFSVELDGKIIRFIRSQRTIRTVFLSAKVESSSVILMVIGIFCILIAQLVSPWPGLSAVGAAVCVGLFVIAECLSVVIGSFANPALFRAEVNVPEPEPKVQIATSMMTMLVMAIGTPLVVWSTTFTAAPSIIGVVLAAIVGLLTPVIGGKLSAPLSRRFLDNTSQKTPSALTEQRTAPAIS